ncbi:NADPH dehydrogenase NamA [Paracholeplasma manati]|uniref:NADPH dehydrogenase NamA n=1 Tax=Paracholeplasma manati TaxID=591373 RepID=A0ABT2Y753_9MOLU|nr:NADPH dehydrogenase NamA [Paracholeplasma manati]MCV2232307.1 NADPH dehydrogenase NamA [Paracholeplasma manati]MDG0888264.1 NADPH dehydrogenase NamA [Paracholeplasma manati]
MTHLFTPITIKNMQLKNRIVMPPMCMYSATEQGMATDFHVIHYASRAIGQVGFIIVEATAIEPDGRITTNDLGVWDDEHVKGLKWITKQIHANDAKACLQIAHAGRKSRAAVTPKAPSAIAFEGYPTPNALTVDEIKTLIELYKQAARRAKEANFDCIEIHAAHGYLIHEFTSPLTNTRTDQYGGTQNNRNRFLYEVIEAVRSEWPMDLPLSLRISAEDYVKEGLHPQQWAEIMNGLPHGYVDIVHVSSGGLVKVPIDDYPGYQLMFAKKIRKETHLMVVAGGLIEDPVMANGVLESDEADLIFFGRLALKDPYFPLRFAQRMRYDLVWPEQYIRAKK